MKIKELLRLEDELVANPCESATSSTSRDARVNMLKYLQIQTVRDFEAAYDALYFELKKEGRLECLRNITQPASKGLLQPKVLKLQDHDGDAELEKQLNFYLADALLAKQRLDKLVIEVVNDSEMCEVHCVGVKSIESTRRKALRFCGGDVRRIADMARVAVVCDTPEALEQTCMAILGLFQPQDVLRVANGYDSDWMPGGYRDVKINPVVNEHLSEIQLHLREFFALKRGQHEVYEWARDLPVRTEMAANHLFKSLSPEVMNDMISLARQNWSGTGYYLPELLVAAGKYDEAEESLRQQLSEAEDEADQVGGFADGGSKERRDALDRINTAKASLSNVLVKQGKYAEAEREYEQCQASMEKDLGSDHPKLAASLNEWALVLTEQGKYEEAEPLYERCQAIQEKALGPEHPSLAATLNNRARLLQDQGKYDEADPLYQRALAIDEKVLGPDHPDVASDLNNWAELLSKQGKYDDAEPLCARAIAIGEKALGPEHPDLAGWLNNRAGLLESQGKYDQADPLYLRAIEIGKKTLGPDHPSLAAALNNRAGLLFKQGNYAEAAPLNERATEIWMEALGPEHPTVATALINRALLLQEQGKYDEADPLYARVLQILAATVGEEHPNYASALNSRALLLYAREKFMEAIPLLERALSIRVEKLGGSHPDTVSSQNSLEIARQKA